MKMVNDFFFSSAKSSCDIQSECLSSRSNVMRTRELKILLHRLFRKNLLLADVCTYVQNVRVFVCQGLRFECLEHGRKKKIMLCLFLRIFGILQIVERNWVSLEVNSRCDTRSSFRSLARSLENSSQNVTVLQNVSELLSLKFCNERESLTPSVTFFFFRTVSCRSVVVLQFIRCLR